LVVVIRGISRKCLRGGGKIKGDSKARPKPPYTGGLEAARCPEMNSEHLEGLICTRKITYFLDHEKVIQVTKDCLLHRKIATVISGKN
jgi:hypothetical protein